MNRAELIVGLEQIFKDQPRWRAVELVADMLDERAKTKDTE